MRKIVAAEFITLDGMNIRSSYCFRVSIFLPLAGITFKTKPEHTLYVPFVFFNCLYLVKAIDGAGLLGAELRKGSVHQENPAGVTGTCGWSERIAD